MIHKFMNATISAAYFITGFYIVLKPYTTLWDTLVYGLIGLLMSCFGCLFAWLAFRQEKQ